MQVFLLQSAWQARFALPFHSEQAHAPLPLRQFQAPQPLLELCSHYSPRNKCSWCFRLWQQLRFPSQAHFHHFGWGLLKHWSSRQAALSAQEALQILIFSSFRPPLRLHYMKNSGSSQRYKPICEILQLFFSRIVLAVVRG